MHIPTFRPAKLYSPDGHFEGDCLASDTVLENFIRTSREHENLVSLEQG